MLGANDCFGSLLGLSAWRAAAGQTSSSRSSPGGGAIPGARGSGRGSMALRSEPTRPGNRYFRRQGRPPDRDLQRSRRGDAHSARLARLDAPPHRRDPDRGLLPPARVGNAAPAEPHGHLRAPTGPMAASSPRASARASPATTTPGRRSRARLIGKRCRILEHSFPIEPRGHSRERGTSSDCRASSARYRARRFPLSPE